MKKLSVWFGIAIAIFGVAYFVATLFPKAMEETDRQAKSFIAGGLAATPKTSVNVKDYGAVGDGNADDRAAIQAAIDAGAEGDVYFPNGTYKLGRGLGFWCITVPARTALRGQSRVGVVLLQAPEIATNVRLIEVDTADVSISRMTLDGNKVNQTKDEHRAAVFANGAAGLTVNDVVAQNFTGDGFYVYALSDFTVWINVVAIGNDRNGFTFGGGTKGGTITKSVFKGNRVQQIDSEPKNGNVVNDITIVDNVLDGDGISNDYVLTVAGSGAATRSSGWVIGHNIVNGPVQIAWSDNIQYVNNIGTNPTTKPCVRVYRRTDDILIARNVLSLSGLAGEVIDVTGTGTGQMPGSVLIARNTLDTGRANAHGVSIINAMEIAVIDNIMFGSGVPAAFVSGVRAKSTIPTDPIRSIIISNNRISNFGQWGVSLAGAGNAKILFADISENTFGSSSAVVSMASALSLDDGTHAAVDVRTRDNTLIGGCSTMTSVIAPGEHQILGERWKVN